MTFLSAGIVTSISMYAFFFLFLIIISGILLLILLWPIIIFFEELIIYMFTLALCLLNIGHT